MELARDLADGSGARLTGHVELLDCPYSKQYLVADAAIASVERLERWVTNAITRLIPVHVQRSMRKMHAVILDGPPTVALNLFATSDPEVLSYGAAPQQHLALFDGGDGDHGSVPVVVFLHGGAWASGSRELYHQVGQSIAQAARCTCCVVGYRLMKPPDGYATMATQMADVRLAVEWCRRRFGRARRLVLAGHSSGAHLALMSVLRGLDCVDCVVHFPQPL